MPDFAVQVHRGVGLQAKRERRTQLFDVPNDSVAWPSASPCWKKKRMSGRRLISVRVSLWSFGTQHEPNPYSFSTRPTIDIARHLYRARFVH